MSQAHRLAVLFDNPIMFGLVDDRHLAAHGVAADVDDREMLCHGVASYHKQLPVEIVQVKIWLNLR